MNSVNIITLIVVSRNTRTAIIILVEETLVGLKTHFNISGVEKQKIKCDHKIVHTSVIVSLLLPFSRNAFVAPLRLQLQLDNNRLFYNFR